MEIKLLRNKDCHVWQKAREALKEALLELNLPQDFEVIVVENNTQAKKLTFPGSPTIKVNGQDVDPLFEKYRNFPANACRIYLFRNHTFEYPPKEMILEALKRTHQ